MIDSGYFSSKYFAIAAAVALLIVGAAAGAFAVGGRVVGTSERACDAPSSVGRELTTAPAVATEQGGERRSLDYAWDAGALAAGVIDLCLSVGEVYVEPSTGTRVEVSFTIESEHEDAVARTVVHAALADDAGRLRLFAWEEVRGEAGGAWFGSRSAEVRLVVRVPESGAWDVRAQNDVGDVRVSGLRVAALDLHTDVGTVHALQVDLEGNASATTDVGDVILDLSSVQSARIEAAADVGEIEVQLPQRADVGYDVTASAEVGEVEVRVGDPELSTTDDEGPGHTVHQRTRGFSSAPTQVTVRATSDVGDIRVIAAPPQ